MILDVLRKYKENFTKFKFLHIWLPLRSIVRILINFIFGSPIQLSQLYARKVNTLHFCALCIHCARMNKSIKVLQILTIDIGGNDISIYEYLVVSSFNYTYTIYYIRYIS